jgi:hypothetical protein
VDSRGRPLAQRPGSGAACGPGAIVAGLLFTLAVFGIADKMMVRRAAGSVPPRAAVARARANEGS